MPTAIKWLAVHLSRECSHPDPRYFSALVELTKNGMGRMDSAIPTPATIEGTGVHAVLTG